MGLLNKAGPWLAKKMKQAATDPERETVIYTRKAGGSVDLSASAWLGRTAFARVPSEGGAAVVWGDRDYLIPVEDLAIAGTPFEPERGDTIAHTKGGVTVTFEAMAPATEPEARYSDPHRTVWRVHTKEVGTD